MTDDLIIASDECFFDGWRIPARAAGGLCEEEEGILVAAPGLPLAWMNNIFVIRQLRDPEAQIAKAIARLDDAQLPFFLRIRDGLDKHAEHAFERLGLRYHESVPGMALSPVPKDGGRDTPLEIRRADSDATFADFVDVTAASYGFDPAHAAHLLPPAIRTVANTQWFVGYADGVPAAAAALFVLGQAAGVEIVGTREEYRGRGFGEAVTWQVVRAGVDAGCRFAVLQASDMGKPVYARMGFRDVASYKTFARAEWLE